MRARVLLNLLVGAGGLLLSLVAASSLPAEEKTQVQPKVTGNYEQLVELQQQAVNQMVFRAKATAQEMQTIRDAINRYKAQEQQRQQLERQQEQTEPEEKEQEEEQPPLRSLEQPGGMEQGTSH